MKTYKSVLLAATISGMTANLAFAESSEFVISDIRVRPWWCGSENVQRFPV